MKESLTFLTDTIVEKGTSYNLGQIVLENAKNKKLQS